jgi:hypothetical protein
MVNNINNFMHFEAFTLTEKKFDPSDKQRW